MVTKTRTTTRRAKKEVEEPVRKTRRAKTEEKPARKKRVVKEKVPAKRRSKAEPDIEGVKQTGRSKRAPKQKIEEKSKRRSRKETIEASEVDEPTLKVFNPLANIDNDLDNLEKSYALTGTSMLPGEKRQTTGLLCLDLVLGGGIVPGWYTTFGPEQSCKSTLTMWMLSACVETDIPVKAMWDYEGSCQGDYLEQMMKTYGLTVPLEQVLGVRNPKTQQWEVKPLVRPYNEITGEKFFDYLAKLERLLPDKKLMGDQWYYVYENTKPNKALVGDRYDKKFFSKTGQLRVPAKDGKLQALILLDSYPAMLPEKQDVDDPGSSMAVQARMFADQLKRVKGRMRSKRIAVLGVNQLRKVPMVMFGNPEQEPCGEALKFFSDCRLKVTPRALSGVPVNGFKGKGMIMEEDSVTHDGTDKYRFIHVKAIKNKLSIPYLESWLRLWIEDATGEARGFDPVWDCFYYLKQTGQLKGDGKKMTLELVKGPTFKKSLTWRGFKLLILGNAKERKETCIALGASKPFNLREFCRNQMDKGIGLDLYMANKSNVNKDKDSEEPEVNENGSDDD